MLVFAILITSSLSVHIPVRAAMTLTAQPYAPNTDTQLRLRWSPVPATAVYAVYRDAEAVPVGVIDVESTLDALSYIDTGLTPGTSYTYEVRAFSDPEMNNLIDSVTVPNAAQPVVATTAMIPPSGLSSVYNINTGEITVTWQSASLAAAQTSIVDASGNNILGTVSAPQTSCTFLDPAATSGISANYYAVSTDGAASTATSQAISVLPVTPPEISATMANGITTVSWNSYAYIQYFSLERSRYNGVSWNGWETVASNIASGAQSITDTPAMAGPYRYRLAAKALSQYTGYSNVTDVVYKPAAPTNLTCSLEAADRIQLQWTNHNDNWSSLVIQRRVGSGSYTDIANVNKETTSYIDHFKFAIGNTYTYRVVAYDSAGNQSAGQECAITITVPAAPGNLQVTITSSAALTVNWTDNSNNESGFKLERKVDSGSFTELVTTTALSFEDTDVTPGHTYTYRVRSYNPVGHSAYSNETAASLSKVVPPESLELSAVSGTQVNLKWGYPGTSLYGTVIERIGGADTTWRTIATLPAGTTTYSDSNNLSPNTTYYYRLKAVAGQVYSLYHPNTAGKEVTTLLGSLALTAYATSGNQIYLSWGGGTGATEYTVERKTQNGTYTVVATLSSNTTWWNDTNVIPNAIYTYRVKGSRSGNQSPYSAEVTVANTYLEAPSALKAEVIPDVGIQLVWTDNSMLENGFEICRWQSGVADTMEYFYTDQNVTSYLDTSIVEGIQYYYAIRAFTSMNDTYSAYTSAVTAGVGIVPAPDDFDYSIASSTSVILFWNDNAPAESGYKVERRMDGSEQWVEIASLAPNVETYTVYGLNPEKKYYFRIKAYSYASGISAYSSELEVTTRKPAVPVNLTLKVVSSNQIDLQWEDRSDNEEGFKVERRGTTGTYTVIAILGPGSSTYSDRTLKPKTKYTYRITAYNKNGTASSSVVSETTQALVTFSDINGTAVSWAKEAIQNLAGRGIVAGDNYNRFRPTYNTTRADFICMVVRAFGLEASAVGGFKDVKPGDWFYSEVMTAARLGIISGGPNNTFRPNEFISREDMAVIAVRAADAAGKPIYRHSNGVLEKYRDKNQISSYATSSLAALVGEGIVGDRSGQYIEPKGAVSRAEAAVLIYRLIER